MQLASRRKLFQSVVHRNKSGEALILAFPSWHKKQKARQSMFALPFTHELTCGHSMQNLLHKEDSHECATLKEQKLREIFRTLGSAIVAYSGGVDSSYVAYVANEELGPRAICITGESASLPSYQ